MRFENLKMSAKLLVGFSVVIAITLILAVFSYTRLTKIDRSYTNLMDNVTIGRRSMISIGQGYANYRRIVASAIFRSGNTEILNSLKAEYEAEKVLVEGYINDFKAVIDADITLSESEKVELKEIVIEIKSKLDGDYDPIAYTTFECAFNNDEAGAVMAVAGASDVAGGIYEYIQQGTETIKVRTDTLNTAATDEANFAKIILIIVSAMSVIFAVANALYIARSIKKGINNVTEAAHKISKGDFNVSVGSNGKDEIAILSNSLLDLKTVIQKLTADINKSAQDFEAGKVDIYLDESSYTGEFKQIVKSVNKTEKSLIGNCMYAIDVIKDFGDGNFDVEVKVFRGEQVSMTNAIKTVKENLIRFNSDIVKIINGAAEGNLDVSMDTDIYKGDWGKMAGSINGLLGAIVKPVRESISVLNKLSEGALDVSVNGTYKGEFAAMKNAINDTLKMLSSYILEISSILTELSEDNLDQSVEREYVGQFADIKYALNIIIEKYNRAISNIFSAASQVSSGAKQISESSMTLAEGSTEQASSTEEASSKLAIINENAKKNAIDAKEADELSDGSKDSAAKGSQFMRNLLTSMDKIKESSSKISQIIKVIDDIAFQTNLLALNAAVEAARAGEHGKGFAVVAEEVRTLAGRSQASAKDTSELIEESIARVNEGTKIADETAAALTTIVDNISSVSDIIANIAESSNEQTSAISQLTDNISQISQIVQSNSATSEESASTAQELSSQAEMLQNLVSAFKLKKTL